MWAMRVFKGYSEFLDVGLLIFEEMDDENWTNCVLFYYHIGCRSVCDHSFMCVWRDGACNTQLLIFLSYLYKFMEDVYLS